MTTLANCTFERVSVEELELDVGNPRVARVLAMYSTPVKPEDMALALGVGDSHGDEENTTTFRSLRESIKTNRGIIHPIIVNKGRDRTSYCDRGQYPDTDI